MTARVAGTARGLPCSHQENPLELSFWMWFLCFHGCVVVRCQGPRSSSPAWTGRDRLNSALLVYRPDASRSCGWARPELGAGTQPRTESGRDLTPVACQGLGPALSRRHWWLSCVLPAGLVPAPCGLIAFPQAASLASADGNTGVWTLDFLLCGVSGGRGPARRPASRSVYSSENSLVSCSAFVCG